MGKNSKQQEAAQLREFKYRAAQEEKAKQEQQNKLIRNTMLIVLAAVLLITGIGIGVTVGSAILASTFSGMGTTG